MHFPEYMRQQRRWLVIPEGKQPVSALDEKPADYAPPPGKEDPNPEFWRWRWQTPAIWVEYETAKRKLDEDADIERLSFSLHPAGENQPQQRIICFDFDGAVQDGQVDPAVRDFLDTVDSFTEYSRSGEGLHCFVMVKCAAFRNLKVKPIGECSVDVLLQSQVAVTGKVYDGFDTLRDVPFSFLESLDFFEFAPVTEQRTKIEWEDDDIQPEHEYLISEMESWPTCIEGECGSLKMYAAACRIHEHGVTGGEALALLQYVEAEPEFTEEELVRIIENAHDDVQELGTFATIGPANEFQIIKTKKKKGGYGFEPISVSKLVAMDLRLEYLVEGAFVDHGALFIGGEEKTFKTGTAVDLLLSLATGKDFLGQFAVHDLRSSVMFTAEIGLPSATLLINRVAESKDVDPSKIHDVDIVETIPSLQVDKRTGQPCAMEAIRGLKRYFYEVKPQVAVFDPLYFAMGGSEASDMYGMGAALRLISEVCSDYGVWPVFCHHSRKKGKTDEPRPMELSDLYGSGVGAFTRQWFLLSHIEPYASGQATLYARMGGSAAGDHGGRGLWEMKINEGLSEDIMERRWDVSMELITSQASSITPEQVEEAISALKEGDKGVTIKDVAFFVEARSEGAVEYVLRDMIKDGRVCMKPGKRFDLNERIEF